MTNDVTITHPHLIMVYGTLKRPWGNNRLLVDYGSVFGGECLTVDQYVCTAQFPTVHPHSRLVSRFGGKAVMAMPSGQLRGELWRVTDDGLRACDRLEGHPRFYCREQVPVTMLDGTPVDGRPWLYVINLQRSNIFPGVRAETLVRPNAEGHVGWRLDEEPEQLDAETRNVGVARAYRA